MTRALLTLLILAGAMLAVAFGDRPPPRADLTYIDKQPAFTLDPQRVSYEQDIRLVSALYDGLVRWDPYTFDIVPGVAERWSVSRDGTIYVFHLRDNARWSSGEPVVSHDFLYAWRRALMTDTAADYASALFHVRGAEAFFQFRANQLAQYAALPATDRTSARAAALRAEAERVFHETVGLSAPDDRTLIVELHSPTPFFLDLCAFPALFPVHPPSVEADVSLDAATGRLDQRHDWTKPPRLITNGAYMLTSWRFKRDMRLVKNPHYWDEPRVRLRSIDVLVVEDPSTAVLAYQTGGADWLTDVLTDYLPDMLADPDAEVYGHSRFGTYFWSFNCTPTLTGGRPNPFHDARVRRAFAMAIDKRAIVEKVRRVGEETADTLIPPGSIAQYDPDRAVGGAPFDPAGARALLAEAGWVDRTGDSTPENAAGEPFPVVELLCSTGSYHQNVALAMGAMLLEGLGVRTRIVQKESKAYRDDLRRRDFMMARGGWFGDFGDPTTFLDIHATGDGNNDRGYSSAEFDGLLARARAEADPRVRLDLLAEAERLTTERDLPILPIWRYRQFYMFDASRVRGLSEHPRSIQRLDYLWIAGDESGGAP
ncbi:MAG: peptide ABC transporter substrate-binding protein [Phycisphaerales bacterium]|nr:peptide ABC transporter substrate-binding protein [Phycisphaerales bacterium]